MSSNAELVRKADMDISTLSSGGGQLNVEQRNTFFRKLFEQPTLLNEARTVVMTAPQRDIAKIGFGTRMLRSAGTLTGQFGLGPANRAAAVGERYTPTFSKVSLSVKELIAEIRIPYEVVEDNIERSDFTTTIVDLMTARAARDLEDLIINGDTASSDTLLKATDGYLKLLNAQGAPTADGQTVSISKTLFKNAVKAMPDAYLRERNALRFYISVDNETQYRDTLADRQTGLGDSTVTGLAPVYAFGTPIAPVSLMPGTQGIFTNPKNLIVGFHRDVLIETDKSITERMWIIVLTLRVDVQVEEATATVLLTNIG